MVFEFKERTHKCNGKQVPRVSQRKGSLRSLPAVNPIRGYGIFNYTCLLMKSWLFFAPRKLGMQDTKPFSIGSMTNAQTCACSWVKFNPSFNSQAN